MFVSKFSTSNDEVTNIRVLKSVYHLFDTRACSNPMGCSASSQDSISYYIQGAPPDGFVAWLATHVAQCSTPREMALLWVRVLDEFRWCWRHKRRIPRLPTEESPDVRCCLLHQQLMLLNGCISRCQAEDIKEMTKTRITKAKLRRKTISSEPIMAEDEERELLRRGCNRRLPGIISECNLNLYEPETQKQALLTETHMRETQEMQMKYTSSGHGVDSLLSDMQAFKAANPFCTFVDFVRWYSPADYCSATSTLSKRMNDTNNMWRELFAQAKAIPAFDQQPIFDAELAGEEALQNIVAIPPSDLMEQLLTVYVAQIHTAASISEHASDED